MGVENSNQSEVPVQLTLLSSTFPDAVIETSVPQGDATALVIPERLQEVMRFLKEDDRLQFDVLVDITAVDYLGRQPRFDVVYHLLSVPRNLRLRIKAGIDPGQELASLTTLWGSANWLEREVWDMFGVRFSGHPDLKRILLYEEFQGHPLRRDYPIQKRQPLIGPKN